jgi:hypothetical protein
MTTIEKHKQLIGFIVIIQLKLFEDIGSILTVLFGSNLFLGLSRKKTPAIELSKWDYKNLNTYRSNHWYEYF